MQEPSRVLVVDPDPGTRERAVAAIEEGEELRAVGVETGDDAATELADDVACLVVRHGPTVDGLSMIASVGERAFHVPVVVLLDPAATATTSDAFDAGATDVVRADGEWEPLLSRRVRRARNAAVSERRLDEYERVVDSLNESVRLVDASGDQQFVNQRTVDLSGLPRERLHGESIRVFEDAGLLDDVGEYERRRDAVLAGESDEERIEQEWGIEPYTTWGETRLTPVGENGEVDGAVAVTRDVSDRRELETRLRESERRLRAIVENTDDPIFIKDPEGEYVFANEATARLFGLSVEKLVGKTDVDLFGETAAAEIRADDEAVMERRETLTSEGEREYADGYHVFQTSKFPYVDEDGDVRGVVGIARDVTGRRRAERSLRELYEVSARTDLDFREKVERVLDIGRERIGLEAGFLAVVDPAADREEAGFRVVVDDGNDEQFADRTESPLSETYCRKTIESDGPLAVTDAEAEGWAGDPAYEKYGLGCYIGSTVTVEGDLYGTLCFTGREPRERPFTEGEYTFLELLTQWLNYELERREREASLRRLVDRINGLIRDTVEVLVESATREEIDERAVDRLVAVEGYDLAWIGHADVDGERITPSAVAGETDVETDARSISLDSDDPGPAGRAFREREPQFRQSTGGEPDDGDSGEHAVDEYPGTIAVPLTYKDARYGVLTVSTDDPDAFDEREVVVLSALGRAIANAYNAIETGRILETDSVIEMELAVRDPELVVGQVTARGDCEVEYAGSVYQPDGSLRLYLSSGDGDPATVVDVLRSHDRVTEATCLADGEDDGAALFEAVVTDDLVSTLADYGAVTKHLESSAGTTNVTVELPAEGDARDLYDLLEDRYGGVELVGYHEHDRPVETRQEFRAALEERLTDRQRTAVRSAFLSGFYEWPRPVSGDELAEAMDISRPTFHQHLRAAQRKLLEELFDPER